MYVIIYMGLFRSARAPWATPAGVLSNAPEVELLESVKATEIALATRRRSPPKYSHIASLTWLSLPLAPALSAEPEPKRLEKLQPVVSARRKKEERGEGEEREREGEKRADKFAPPLHGVHVGKTTQ